MSSGSVSRRVREVAADLSVDESTVYRWIAEGELPAYRFGHSVRIDPQEYEEFRRKRRPRRDDELPQSAERVYAIGSEDQRLVKIGRSCRLGKRLTTLRNACPVPLALLWHAPGGAPAEAALHIRFAAHRIRGEWFEFPGGDAVAVIDRAFRARFAPRFRVGQQVEIVKPDWKGPRYGTVLGCGVTQDDVAKFHVGPAPNGMVYIFEGEDCLREVSDTEGQAQG